LGIRQTPNVTESVRSDDVLSAVALDGADSHGPVKFHDISEELNGGEEFIEGGLNN
jgi:hypothetical protein